MSTATFGPPLLSVALENSSAIITLRGPMRYQPNNHTPLVSMAMLYPHMMYNLSIENTRRNKTVSKKKCQYMTTDRLLSEAHLTHLYERIFAEPRDHGLQSIQISPDGV